VDGLAPIRGVLRKLGAKLVWRGAEASQYFEHPLLRLSETGKTLRLRKWPGHSAMLTLKSKLGGKDAKYKIREEKQTYLRNFSAMEKILLGLGFVKTQFYRKKREHWSYGGAHIELDVLRGIRFVEIEGSAAKIKQMAGLLGLKMEDGITKSYLAISKELKK
jgi:predicted adenylyl cyclase CyaB